MLSAIHNVIVGLLDAHPEALSYLLALQGAEPAGPLVPTTDTRTKTVNLERRLDGAFLVGSREAPKSFVFAEVQLDADDEKGRSWPLSLELGRSRYRCEGALVVLTVSEAVRRWIERVIVPPTGAHGTLRQLRPTVVALDEILPDLLLRPDMPYLAPLAVAAHSRTPDACHIAERAVDLTVERLPSPLAAEQLDVILAMVNTTFIVHLKQRVAQRTHGGYFRNLYEKGVAEGKVEGKVVGLAEGEAKGKAEGVLLILAGRGIPVSSAIRKRILACRNIEVLDRWLQRALEAPTAAAAVRAAPPRRRTVRRPPPRSAKR